MTHWQVPAAMSWLGFWGQKVGLGIVCLHARGVGQSTGIGSVHLGERTLLLRYTELVC